MTVLPKAIYRFNAIPIKVPMTVFTELQQTIQKFIWNHKRPRITQAILRNKKTSRRHNSPRPQAILQNHSQQDSVVLVPRQTDRLMEQNTELRNKPWHQWSIKLWQRRQEHKMGKQFFSKNCWETWTVACKSVKLEHTLTPCTKINSKWLKDLNIPQDTIKLLEENRQNTLWHPHHEYFLMSVSQSNGN